MALPMLMNGGADCGPSNALQGFAKQFDHDRGPVHDHFGQGAGPSRETFRTRPSGAAANPLADDAAQFFSSASTPASSSGIVRGPFDVSALRGALPAAQAPAPTVSRAASGWAADFARAAGGSVGVSAGAEWALQMQAQGGVQKVEGGVMPQAPQMQMN
ncbi:hypothetical protein FRC08_017577, partial [Ceratobasidium sp. 394]